jgi:hypothetical protein
MPTIQICLSRSDLTAILKRYKIKDVRVQYGEEILTVRITRIFPAHFDQFKAVAHVER